MNDNADTIETAELDKVVADVLNYDNMMNVDMYIDECLKEININDEHFEDMAEHCVRNGIIDGYKPLDKDSIIQIFKSSL